MAKEFFKNLPDTSTPITASRLNGLLDGEEAMGNIVVDSIRSKNLFNKSNIIVGYFEVNDTIQSNEYNRIAFIKCEPNTTYTISKSVASSVFMIATTTEYPKLGVQTTYLGEDTSTLKVTVTTGSTAQYLLCRFAKQVWANGDDVEEIVNSLQFEKGSVATEYVDYIDVAPKNSFSTYTYLTATTTITGQTYTPINEKLKATNFLCKTGKILVSANVTFKVSSGISYLALKLVNKETEEIITAGGIVGNNSTTDLNNAGTRIYDVPPGIYDIYLCGSTDGANRTMTIKSYCTITFTILEI